jgi:proteasome lid subunit RPN8/RPN11
MSFSLQAIIRDLVAPKRKLSCTTKIWKKGLVELRRRGKGQRESGAFLLGTNRNGKGRIERFVFYDDLDAHCLETGIIVFDGVGYGPLWELCTETGLIVVADVHTHGGAPIQSSADRKHPMIALAGHIALIVPGFANRVIWANELGIYEYEGAHRWNNRSGKDADSYFYVGMWG